MFRGMHVWGKLGEEGGGGETFPKSELPAAPDNNANTKSQGH